MIKLWGYELCKVNLVLIFFKAFCYENEKILVFSFHKKYKKDTMRGTCKTENRKTKLEKKNYLWKSANTCKVL